MNHSAFSVKEVAYSFLSSYNERGTLEGGKSVKEEMNQLQLEESNLIDFLSNDLMDAFREEFMQLHPYDQSLFFEKVDPEIRKKIFHYLSPKEMAELFEATKFEEEQYDFYLKEMDTTYAADMLSYMYR